MQANKTRDQLITFFYPSFSLFFFFRKTSNDCHRVHGERIIRFFPQGEYHLRSAGGLRRHRLWLFFAFAGNCPGRQAVSSRICSSHKYHKSCARAAAVLWPTFPSWSVEMADPASVSLCRAETRRPVHSHPVGGDAAGHSGGNEIPLRYGIRPSRSGRTEHPRQQQSRM